MSTWTLRVIDCSILNQSFDFRLPPRTAQERRNGLFHLTLMQASVEGHRKGLAIHHRVSWALLWWG